MCRSFNSLQISLSQCHHFLRLHPISTALIHSSHPSNVANCIYTGCIHSLHAHILLLGSRFFSLCFCFSCLTMSWPNGQPEIHIRSEITVLQFRELGIFREGAQLKITHTTFIFKLGQNSGPDPIFGPGLNFLDYCSGLDVTRTLIPSFPWTNHIWVRYLSQETP